MFRQLAVATSLLTLVLSAGGVVALAHEKSEQTVIKSRDFTIPKAQCPQLPAELEIKGLGLERTTTVVESAHDGDKHQGDGDEGSLNYSFLTRITGTATDNLGGTYTFTYQLSVRKPVTLPGPGLAVDTFKLTGTGAADGLSTSFKVRVTFDSGANPIAFEILEQSGEPFSCDPL